MEWQTRLIGTYVKTCDLWRQGLSCYVDRMSNNDVQELSDEEVITIFLNGIMTGRTTLKGIFNFTTNHLAAWFPKLGSYESFVRRLNRISNVFVVYLEMLSAAISSDVIGKTKLIDSMPIVLAKAKRSEGAKVSPEHANKGYCGSKDLFYYGVKLHIIGIDRDDTLPIPEYIALSPASYHDIAVFKQVAPELENCDVFGDKAYANVEENLLYKAHNNLQVATPVKLEKRQKRLDSADKLYSKAVSQIRQPIESLFNWLQEKTGIQVASKVRSSSGLMVHTFGRLTAGMLMLLNF